MFLDHKYKLSAHGARTRAMDVRTIQYLRYNLRYSIFMCLKYYIVQKHASQYSIYTYKNRI